MGFLKVTIYHFVRRPRLESFIAGLEEVEVGIEEIKVGDVGSRDYVIANTLEYSKHVK